MEPIVLIDALRQSDEYIETIYTRGSCYRFHLFLNTIYPQAIPYITDTKDHIITFIDGAYYDISGIVPVKLMNIKKMTKRDIQRAEKWSFSRNMMLRITYCPSCDEDITDSMVEEANSRQQKNL